MADSVPTVFSEPSSFIVLTDMPEMDRRRSSAIKVFELHHALRPLTSFGRGRFIANRVSVLRLGIFFGSLTGAIAIGRSQTPPPSSTFEKGIVRRRFANCGARLGSAVGCWRRALFGNRQAVRL